MFWQRSSLTPSLPIAFIVAPPFVKSVVPIACGAAHTAWQIAVSEVQRQAIMADPHWSSDEPEKATAGLAVARQMGMVSYRTPQGYHSKFGRKLQHKKGATDDDIADAPKYGSKVQYQAQSYLHYQGIKFLSRFDPVTYVKMTEQMDSHDISRGRGGPDGDASLEDILATVEIPALVMGIDSDVLYPLEEQEFLANALPNGTLKVIHSPDGHDGFLLEQEQVGNNIIEFLNENRDE
jgi:homoserine O-acetyltransferase